MLPTVQTRWSLRCSYAIWLCGFYYEAFDVDSYLVLCCHMLSVLYSIMTISFAEERAGLCVSCAFVCLSCVRYFLAFVSSSLCQELSAACDYGTPWTFFS